MTFEERSSCSCYASVGILHSVYCRDRFIRDMTRRFCRGYCHFFSLHLKSYYFFHLSRCALCRSLFSMQFVYFSRFLSNLMDCAVATSSQVNLFKWWIWECESIAVCSDYKLMILNVMVLLNRGNLDPLLNSINDRPERLAGHQGTINFSLYMAIGQQGQDS